MNSVPATEMNVRLSARLDARPRFHSGRWHIFCTEDQILSECTAYTKLVQKVYADYGFTDISYKIATRPEKRIGDDATWIKQKKL